MSELGYEVFCHICGKPYDEQDPEVCLIYTDHVWECFEEEACLERAALERMLWWKDVCPETVAVTGSLGDRAELICTRADGHNGLHYDAADGIWWKAGGPDGAHD